MGCNSHLSIEIQGEYNPDSKDWSTWALDIPESRDYKLYEAMAGARGEEENAVVAPRGIPVDVSDPIKYWITRYGEDGHTHSWLYPNEFHEAVIRAEVEPQGPVDRCWAALDKILNVLEGLYGEKHVRVVFFFDN